MSKVQTITTNELKQKLDQKGDFQFWNVLTDEYFKGEIIPGSKRVPLDTLGREVASSGLSPAAEIIVYCAGPSCPASVQAAEKLTALGFTDVKAFEGGLEEWKKAGWEIETIPNALAA